MFYVDGFNLYHAISDLKQPALKWLALRSLCESYCKPHNVVVRIAYFTALNIWDKGKRERHVDYINALEARNVEIIRGSFDRPQKYCTTANRYCRNYGEKKTDVGIAVNLLADALERRCDISFLISADSDHVPLAERLKRSVPNHVLFVISAPNRIKQSQELVAKVGRKAFQLTAGRLRQHLLPPELRNETGKLLVARPALYGSHN